MPVRAVLFDLADTLILEAHEPDEDALYAAMAEHVRSLVASGAKLLDRAAARKDGP